MSLTLSVIADNAINQMFAGLDGVLQKGAAAAKAKDVDEAVYLNWRLASDMFPMKRQVQIATEIPARGLSRLAGADLPSFADDEETFDALRARIGKAKDIIAGLSKEAIDAEPDAMITVPLGQEEMTFPRINYLQNFVLPNVYFHVTTTYAILRHLGVDIGKRDFVAAPPQ